MSKEICHFVSDTRKVIVTGVRMLQMKTAYDGHSFVRGVLAVRKTIWWFDSKLEWGFLDLVLEPSRIQVNIALINSWSGGTCYLYIPLSISLPTQIWARHSKWKLLLKTIRFKLHMNATWVASTVCWTFSIFNEFSLKFSRALSTLVNQYLSHSNSEHALFVWPVSRLFKWHVRFGWGQKCQFDCRAGE